MSTTAINKYQSFFTGVLNSIGAKPDHIDECILPEYKIDKSNDFADLVNTFMGAEDDLKTLLKGLDKGIDIQCSNRNELVEYFDNMAKLNKAPKFIQVNEKMNLNSKSKLKRNSRSKSEGKKSKNSTASSKSNEKKSKFGPFDNYFLNRENYKKGFSSILNTSVVKKSIDFLSCYKNAHGVLPVGKNTYLNFS